MSNEQPLSGKVALITGGARGMGAATAQLFVAQGARVLVTDILDGAETLGALGTQAAFLHHDVTDEPAWNQVIAYAQQLFGQLDILVNNAGIMSPGGLQDTSPATMERFFKVNQLGPYLGMRAAIEPLKASGGGVIINMSSCLAMRGIAGHFAYSASKWAVRGMTKCAALELAQFKIRVNSVHPGPIDTPMLDAYSAEEKAAAGAQVPWGRLGRPEEVAAAIAFLASDAAGFISGAELLVDGAVFA